MLKLVEAFDPKKVAKKIKKAQYAAWNALNRHDDEAVKKIQGLLANLEKRLKSEIGRLDSESFKAQHLGRMEVLVNDLIRDFEHDADVLIRSYVPSAMKINQGKAAEMAVTLLNTPAQIPLPVALPNSLLSATASLSSEMIKGLSADVRKQVVSTLGRAVLGDQTPFETARQIGTVIGSRGGVGASAAAERIVRTEVGRAFSLADEFFNDAMDKARPEDLPALRKIWISMDDSRVRHSHDLMHKKHVGVNQDFTVPIFNGKGQRKGSEKMSGPRAVGGSAGNVINCRCTLVTVPEDILEETLAGFPG